MYRYTLLWILAECVCIALFYFRFWGELKFNMLLYMSSSHGTDLPLSWVCHPLWNLNLWYCHGHFDVVYVFGVCWTLISPLEGVIVRESSVSVCLQVGTFVPPGVAWRGGAQMVSDRHATRRNTTQRRNCGLFNLMGLFWTHMGRANKRKIITLFYEVGHCSFGITVQPVLSERVSHETFSSPSR